MRDLETEGRNFRSARGKLVELLGRQRIRALHRPDYVKAATRIGAVLAAIGANAWILAGPSFGLIWLPSLVLQGFLLQDLGYMMHEFGVHRGLKSARVSDAFGTAMGLPLFTSYTTYRLIHTDHHRHTGAAWDEGYKQGIDTRWNRLLNLTAPGLLYFLEQPPIHPSSAEAARIVWEKRALYVFAIGVLAALVYFPGPVGLGYLLPLATTLPLASNLRLILEHGESNPDNEFHSGTYYRSGLLMRALFFWDAGDCHLVHHLFPGIPSYRMAEATRLMRPTLLALGVRERNSLAELLHLWFAKGVPHRSLWPDCEKGAPEGAQT